MDERSSTERWLTAAECARRIGLSVRALRLYEQHGLIAPRRTGKSWRLYGPDEIARLNEVLALKSLGLRLASIAELLKDRPTDLMRLLEMQQEGLRSMQERAQRGLATIGLVQSKIAARHRRLDRRPDETRKGDQHGRNFARYRRLEALRAEPYPRTEV